jgi:hypothetical protein
MKLDTAATAAASYARTLIARGCPEYFAHTAAAVLADVDGVRARTTAEQLTVERAWQAVT